MPLNYSKWDALEVSDDSDIEGHPNVDHASLVRWKQRDIHEKREARKRRIAELKSIIALNEVLIPRVREILTLVEAGGPSQFSQIYERLKTQPSPAKPDGGQQTYDNMLENLLLKITDDLKAKGTNQPDTSDLVDQIKSHIEKMVKTDDDARDALKDEEEEQKKKITSDDMHDGFSVSKLAPKEPEIPPSPLAPKPKAAKAKGEKTTEPTIEVLNPKAPAAPAPAPAAVPPQAEDDADDENDDEDEDERIPDLEGALLEFSKIPVGKFEKSYSFIQAHGREILRPGTYDELVIAGFRSAVKGDKVYAKQCIHQALIVQYCEKLGKDGVQLFFKRMSSGDPRAKMVFDNDMEGTYNMMLQRAEKAKEDEESPRERIQLVAEDPSQRIRFNVPDGPPPETVKLEGPGTEGLDPEEVKKALQARWDIFQSFDPDLQKALKRGRLEGVNAILGDMDVPRAEEVVKLLEIAGILSFSTSDIIDRTKEGKGDEEATVEEITEEVA